MKTQALPKNILKYFIMLLFILFINDVSAVGEFGGDPDVIDGPVDGGISLLMLAGAAYGARKLYEYKNNTTE